MAGKPKPYRRERVLVGGPAAAKKEWQHVTADRLSVGDIVADLGQVEDITPAPPFSSSYKVRNINGDILSVPNGQTVFAFTSAP